MKKVKVKILKAFDNKSLGSFTTIVDDENYDFELVEKEDISIGSFEIVEVLPDDPETNKIYLLKNSAEVEANYYDEYIYVEKEGSWGWELIGSTQVDLSNYYTKDQVYNKTEINNTLNNYVEQSKVYTKDEINETLQDYTKNVDLATVATSGSYNDLTNKPVIPVVPTNVSAFTNDAGYLTEHQDISGKQDEIKDLDAIRAGATLGSTAVQPEIGKGLFSGNYNDLTNKPTIPAEQIQSDWSQTTTTAKDYIKNKPNLATVATSGSYNDLSNKPTIPTAVSQLSNDRYVRYDTSSQGLSTTQKSNARTNIGAASSSDLVNKVNSTAKVTFNGAYREGDQEIGSLTLHNVAETGLLNDLRDTHGIIKAYDSNCGLKDVKIELVHGFETSNIYGVDCLSLNNEYSYDYGYLKISYEVTSLTAELNLYYSAFGGVQDAYISIVDTALTQDTSTDYYGDIYAHCDLTASGDPYEKPNTLSFKLDSLGGLGKHFVTFKVITSSSPYGPFFYLDLKNKESLIHYDSVPTEGSDNLVTSGGIYDAIQQGGGGSVDAYTKAETNELLTVSENRIEELIEGGPTPGSDWSSRWVAHSTEIDRANLPTELQDIIDNPTSYQDVFFDTLGYYSLDSSRQYRILKLTAINNGMQEMSLFAVQWPVPTTGISFITIQKPEIDSTPIDLAALIMTEGGSTFIYFNNNDYKLYRGYLNIVLSPEASGSISLSQVSSSYFSWSDGWCSGIWSYREEGTEAGMTSIHTKVVLAGQSYLHKIDWYKIDMGSNPDEIQIPLNLAGKNLWRYNSNDGSYIVAQWGETTTFYRATADWSLQTLVIEEQPSTELAIASVSYWDRTYTFVQDISSGFTQSTFKAYYLNNNVSTEEAIIDNINLFAPVDFNLREQYGKGLNSIYYDSANNKVKLFSIDQEGNCPWNVSTTSVAYDPSDVSGSSNYYYGITYIGQYNDNDYFLAYSSYMGTSGSPLLLRKSGDTLYIAGVFSSTDTNNIFIAGNGNSARVFAAVDKNNDLYFVGTNAWSYDSATSTETKNFSLIKIAMTDVLSQATGKQSVINLTTGAGGLGNVTTVYSGQFTRSSGSTGQDANGIDFIYDANDIVTDFIFYPVFGSDTYYMNSSKFYKLSLAGTDTLKQYSFGYMADQTGVIIYYDSLENAMYLNDGKVYIQYHKGEIDPDTHMSVYKLKEGIFNLSDAPSSMDPNYYVLETVEDRVAADKNSVDFGFSKWSDGTDDYLFNTGTENNLTCSLYKITDYGIDWDCDLIFDLRHSALAQEAPVVVDNKILRCVDSGSGVTSVISFMYTEINYTGGSNSSSDSLSEVGDTTSFENTLINLFAVADDRYASKGDTPTPTPTPVGEQKYLHEVYLQYIWGTAANIAPTVVKFTIIDNVNNPYTAIRLMERVGTLGESLKAVEIKSATTPTDSRLYHWTLHLDTSGVSSDYPYVLEDNANPVHQIFGYSLVNEDTTVEDIITPL